MMTQPLQIGWIDFGSHDRNKILSVLSLLSTPEAVDELGIGVIRDGFADMLFPGTSTVQTRAKYFLIVPYLFLDSERELRKKSLSAREFLGKLNAKEIELIATLKQGNAEGVIGGRSGEKLQRKPSNIYWNGLYTFGIFNPPVRLSLDSYVKVLCGTSYQTQYLAASGYERQDRENDDEDAQQGLLGAYWQAPLPAENWRENITIDLTPEEAEFLRDKIIRSPRSKESLMAHLLREKLFDVVDFEELAAIQKAHQLPAQLASDLAMAERFSDFIYGATIRYNIILAEGKNQDANAEWEDWLRAVRSDGLFQSYDVYEPFTRLGINGRNKYRTLPFLQRWKQLVLAGDVGAMDQLVIAREIELKGKERAKLRKKETELRDEEIVVRGGKLQFRFRNARRLMADIRKGLE